MQQPSLALARLIVKVSRSHRIKHTHGIGIYLYKSQLTQETNIHALSGIRTRDPSNHAASDLCLSTHGHRNRLDSVLSTVNFIYFYYRLSHLRIKCRSKMCFYMKTFKLHKYWNSTRSIVGLMFLIARHICHNYLHISFFKIINRHFLQSPCNAWNFGLQYFRTYTKTLCCFSLWRRYISNE
jgi:hypothetical protein